MTSKERVRAAFDHKQPDQVAVDFCGMSCSMINAQTMSDLRDYYGLEKKLPKINDMSTMTAFIEEDLAQIMGTDVDLLHNYGDTYGHNMTEWKEWEYRGKEILIPANCTLTEDGNGGWYVYPEGDSSVPASGHFPAGGFYFDNLTRTPEFDEDEANPDDNVADYMPVSDAQIAYHKSLIGDLKAKGRAVCCTPCYCGLGDANNVPGPNIKDPKGIRSISEWYTAPLLYPEYVEEVFEKGTDIIIQNMARYWEEFGSDIDIMFTCGTDFGTQRGPFMSTSTFEEYYLPYYKKVNHWIHENTTWKTLKHSCGGIFPILPYLIEAEFDGVNPVQCSAEGMDPKALKETYGKDILFWGGVVDTQQVLPFGTPEEVREQVLERMDIFGKDGGYVANSIHCIQANTPVENIAAMVDAMKEFNGIK